MITYHEALTEYRGDLKEWQNLLKTNEDLAETFPEHEDILKLTIDALEQAIERERDGDGGWISVDKKLPEDDEYVLITCEKKNGQRTVLRAYYYDGDWHGNVMSEVIAWMPMPKPYMGD